MHTVKFQMFSNPEFITSFNALLDVNLPIETSNKVSKLHEMLAVKNQDYLSTRNEIIKEHAQKSDDGEPVLDENGNVIIKAEHEELLNEDFRALLDTEFELEKLSLKELEGITLPARAITSLRIILLD